MTENMTVGGEDNILTIENLPELHSLDAEFELEMESAIKEVSLFSLILHLSYRQDTAL